LIQAELKNEKIDNLDKLPLDGVIPHLIRLAQKNRGDKAIQEVEATESGILHIPPDAPPPEPLWPQFEALAGVPVLGIRGEHSDLLSAGTFAEMARRHPAFESLVVEGQGHPPLLLDAPTICAIARFVARFP